MIRSFKCKETENVFNGRFSKKLPQNIQRLAARKLTILAEANEKLDRFYEIKSQGYTIGKVEKRVMEIFGVEKDVIYSKGRRRIQVAARSLLCYWAVREL